MKIIENPDPKDMKLYGLLAHLEPDFRKHVLENYSYSKVMGANNVHMIFKDIKRQLKLLEKQRRKR